MQRPIGVQQVIQVCSRGIFKHLVNLEERIEDFTGELF